MIHWRVYRRRPYGFEIVARVYNKYNTDCFDYHHIVTPEDLRAGVLPYILERMQWEINKYAI